MLESVSLRSLCEKQSFMPTDGVQGLEVPQ